MWGILAPVSVGQFFIFIFLFWSFVDWKLTRNEGGKYAQARLEPRRGDGCEHGGRCVRISEISRKEGIFQIELDDRLEREEYRVCI